MSKYFSNIVQQRGFTFFRRKKANPVLKWFLHNAKTSAGFTLVELLISVVIIVILSTIGIASFASANRRSALQNQAKEIQSNLRAIRTDSVAALKPTQCDSPSGTPNPKTFYGIYVNLTPGTGYSSGVSCFEGTTQVSIPTSTVTFQEGVSISAIDGPGTGNFIYFNFNGDVYRLSSAPATKAEAENPSSGKIDNPVRITLSDGTNPYYVYINGTGLVCAEPNSTTTCAQNP
jgi:prepilin-type N-terminal cleavage/methylation domain-containing protein